MLRITTLALCALALGGCFELTADAKFNHDGVATVAIEIGVSAQLLALAQNKEGASDPFGSCGNVQRMEEAPKGIKLISGERGVKGDKLTCRIIVEIADPVAAAAEFKREAKDDDPLIIDTFKLSRLGSNAYRLDAAIEANPAKAAPTAKPGAEAMGQAMAAAMMANHFISFSVTSDRIEKTTGEVSADGRTVTWRLPVVMLVAPVPGFRQDIKADIVYRESLLDRARRFIGLD